MYRYLAIVWNPHSLESVRATQPVRNTLTSEPGWSIAYEGPGALVIHTGLRKGSREIYPLKNNSGVILGKLFDRHHFDYAAPHSIRFDEKETQRIVSSGGRHVIEHYWGSYVAFVYDESTSKHHVFRDPTGTLPCYHTDHQSIDIFFYDIDDCVRLLPLSFSINRHFLARWLVSPSLASRETGLENVEEPLGGECLTFSSGKTTRALLWNPVEIARTPRFEEPDEAARELRSVVQNTINAWASCYQNIIHKLSGGLDSSIVAACLAHAPSQPHVTYLNHSADVRFDQEPLYLPGFDQRAADKLRALAGTGNERYFARLVAELWKTPVIEADGAGSADWTRLWQVPLKAIPTHYFGGIYTDDLQTGLVRTHGTQAFFSGEAGDIVFVASHQPLSAIDYASLHGIRRDFWRHLIAACNLGRESVWAVLMKTIKRGILHRAYHPHMSWMTVPTLLKLELTQNLTVDDFEGPLGQLVSRSPLPPGKRNHVKSLGTTGYHHGEFHSAQYADNIDPLNSQPIWELMLQIPIYTVLLGGISRGLARHAFADFLPVEIRNRQVKGSGSPELQHLLRKNKNLWREQLQDGLLIQGGYLDRQKLTDCLAAEEPFLVADSSHIANCLTAEIWLQQWQTISRKQLLRSGRQAAAVAV